MYSWRAYPSSPRAPVPIKQTLTRSLTSCAAKLLRTSTTPCEEDVKSELNAKGRRRKSGGYASPAVLRRPNSLRALIADTPVHDVMAHRLMYPIGLFVEERLEGLSVWTSVDLYSSLSFLSAHPVVSFPHFSFLLP